MQRQLLWVALALPACSEFGLEPDRFILDADPDIVVSPTFIDFGALSMGQTDVRAG